MGKTRVIHKPVTQTDPDTRFEDMFEVILHNDDYNTMDHVIKAIMQVFGHPEQLALKIMREAHESGKAVAEVEGESRAQKHRDQLQSFGLTATIEKL